MELGSIIPRKLTSFISIFLHTLSLGRTVSRSWGVYLLPNFIIGVVEMYETGRVRKIPLSVIQEKAGIQ